MKNNFLLYNILYSMLANKCPKCHKDDVFNAKNPYRLKRMFDMKRSCSHCHTAFEREPGFFYGAMYVSYAITSGWFIIWFALQSLVFHLDTLLFIFLYIVFVVITAPVNLRWSRLLWLNFFIKYEKEKNYIKEGITHEKVFNK